MVGFGRSRIFDYFLEGYWSSFWIWVGYLKVHIEFVYMLIAIRIFLEFVRILNLMIVKIRLSGEKMISIERTQI